MSTKFMRSLPSPSLVRPAGAPRSILKRPASLPLSPGAFPYQASFSILVSQSPGSPHVHFPNSASLTSMFSTFSPTTYDRAAIVVSPNPLALPAHSDRIFSPTTGVFKSAAERSLDDAVEATVNSPAVTITDFDKEAIAKPMPASRASLRFQEKIKARPAAPLPRDAVDEPLGRFPRSPYPSAPMSPMTEAVRQEAQRPVLGRVSTMAPNADARKLLSPVEESPETRLSKDFWQSVTLSETPTSAVPQFVFGTRDGALWSPGLPRNMDGMLSPMSRTTFGKVPDVKALMSPAVNDPYAGFPSFSSVLSQVQRPPKAVVGA